MVVLEDLHWADQSSVHLLSLVAPEIAQHPVLLVLTHRDHECPEPVVAALGSIRRLPGTIDLPLVGLDQTSVHRFVEHVAGEPVDEDVARAITERTSGNPLFVTELTRLLRSELALHDVERAPDVVPDTVRDVIRRRVARLPPQTANLLTIAAVLGRRFDSAVLADVAELDVDEVVGLVEAGVAIGLVTVSAERDGTFAFTHDLVQHTLRAEVSGIRRARLHQRTVHALLARADGRLPDRPFEVAHHMVQALPLFPTGEVAERVLAAADAASARLAFDQAERELQRALALVGPEATQPHARLELATRARLARVISITLGHGSAAERQHLDRALELVGTVRPGAEATLALWSSGLSDAMPASSTRRCRSGDSCSPAAMSTATRRPPTSATPSSAASSATAGRSGRRSTTSSAIELLDGGRIDLGPLPDRTRGGWTRASEALVTWFTGDAEGAARRIERALDLADAGGEAFALVFARNYAAWIDLLRGDRDGARSHAEAVIREASTLGYHQFAVLGRILRAASLDDPVVRAGELERGAAEWAGTGALLYQTFFLALRAEAELDLDHTERAESLLGTALAAAAGTGERFYQPEVLRLLALAAERQGRPEEARAHRGRGEELARELGLTALGARIAADR